MPGPQSAWHVCHREGGIQSGGLSLPQARQENQTQMFFFVIASAMGFSAANSWLSLWGPTKAELGQNEFLTAGVDGALDGYGLWTQVMSTAQTPQTLGNGKAFFWVKSARLTRTDQRVRIPTTLLPPHG